MSTDDNGNGVSPRKSLTGLRVSKVRELENSNKELIQRVTELENICIQFQKENKRLSKIIEENIGNIQSGTSKTIQSQNDEVFETDEEELSRETDWILQKNKKKQRQSKKRKAESSPECPGLNIKRVEKKNGNLHDPSKPQRTNVIFECPGMQKSNETLNLAQNKEQQELRPPPIVASNIDNFQDFHYFLKSTIKNNFLIKLFSKGAYKISTFSADDYRNVTKAMNASKIDWYSYENKQTRPIKVMVKNLHYSHTPDSIVADLRSQGFKAIEAVNKFQWKSKEPLNMFRVAFESTDDIKKIYEIKHILNTIVQIEPVRQQKLIPQCKNCQAFGHTKNYCNKQPRCIKCAGKHSTIECKQEITQPKCSNCDGPHPATYRGCIVAKELQKLRDNTIKTRNTLNRIPGNLGSHPTAGNVKPHTNLITVSQNVKGPHNQIKQADKQYNVGQSKHNTYASVLKAQNTNSIANDALSQILNRLSQQEEFFKTIEYRLTLLEQIVQQY